MYKKSYISIFLSLTMLILSFTSCTDVIPVKGNGKIIKKEFQVNDFSKFEIDGFFKVVLSQGETSKLEIEADENLMEYMNVKVKNKKLKIQTTKNISESKIIIIYLTINTLDQLTASGYTIVSSEGNLNFDKLNLDLSGNSKINMNINCVELKTELSGNCTAGLSGAILTATINQSGSSNLNAFDLFIDDLKLNVSGSAFAKVNVINKFNVTISGSGNVEYMGSPEMKQEITGTGIITKKY